MTPLEIYFNYYVWIVDGLSGVVGLLFIFNGRITHYIQDLIIYLPPFRLWQVGAVICSCGLIAQSFWSLEALTTQLVPTSYFWYLKDFGIKTMGFSIVWYGLYIARTLKKLRN